MVTRRQFLKAGVIGGAALAMLGAWQLARQRTTASNSLDARHLILSAIVPAMLAGVLPEDATARRGAVVHTIARVDQTIAGLSPAVQTEVAELFALLNTGVTRVLLAGVWADWQVADAASIAAFLERWRSSSWLLMRSAYGALHDLILGAWYSEPSAWAAIGYPGPPEIAR